MRACLARLLLRGKLSTHWLCAAGGACVLTNGPLRGAVRYMTSHSADYRSVLLAVCNRNYRDTLTNLSLNCSSDSVQTWYFMEPNSNLLTIHSPPPKKKNEEFESLSLVCHIEGIGQGWPVVNGQDYWRSWRSCGMKCHRRHTHLPCSRYPKHPWRKIGG